MHDLKIREIIKFSLAVDRLRFFPNWSNRISITTKYFKNLISPFFLINRPDLMNVSFQNATTHESEQTHTQAVHKVGTELG